MIDAELRGLVLHDFYSRRNTIAPVHVSEIFILLSSDEENRITGICRELNHHNLIAWQDQERMLSSFGFITIDGVNVVEGNVRAPINMILPANSGPEVFTRSPSLGPTAVPLDVDKLLADIDLSDASPLEKVEAKSLLMRVASNPLLQTILAAAGSQNTIM